jgi:hypothetical protein
MRKQPGGESGWRCCLVENRRAERLEYMGCDWAAHTTALGTADAAKWVKRRESCQCLTQPRATVTMNIPTGPCGRPTM